MKTYWIWSWSKAVKGIFTLCSGIELSTEVVIVLRIILLLVKSYNTISLSAEVDGKRKRKKKEKEKEKSSAAYRWCSLARHQSRHSE